ncbi:MAG: type IV toxin-antitoxin system AbiEi family antitoxin domain-containing protein [Nocardioides sp.]
MFDPRTHALLDDTFPLHLDQPFTRAVALSAGLSDNQLKRLCARDYLRRPLRNLYLPTQLPDTVEVRLAALSLVVPSNCFVGDHTAAWLHAGDDALPPNAHLAVPPVSIFRPPRVRALRNGWTASGERTLLPNDLIEIGGLLVTTPLRTALDLGRLQRNPDVALWGMDSMLGTKTFTHGEMLAELPRFKGDRGIVRMRVLAPRADGRSQSFGEAALRGRWYDAGLPRPWVQIPILENGRVIFWLDMGLEELLFAAEYDGEKFHSEDEDREHDHERRDWLARNRAWVIEEFRKVNVFGRRQDATERLAVAYQQSRKSIGNRRLII